MIVQNITEATFGVDPLYNGEGEDTGKQINFFHTDSKTLYSFPLDEDGVKAMLKRLALDNDDLEILNEKDKKKYAS